MTFKKITSVKGLVESVNTESYTDFFISLGGTRSSKQVRLLGFNRRGGARFHVHNEIDGSMQTLTEASLFTRSNIGEAITKGAFYAY